MRTLPLHRHDANDDDDDFPDEHTLEDLPQAEPVDDAGPVDMAMIRNAAETFHTEFMTRVLAGEQGGSAEPSPRRIWIIIALLTLFTALGAAVLALLPPVDSGPPRADSDVGKGDVGSPADGPRPSRPKRVSDSGGSPAPDQSSNSDAGAASDLPRQPRTRLRPRGYGFLNLNSIPWSQVTIDGRRMKRPTPLLRLKLRAGRHRIVLVNRERRLRKVIRVRVRAGQTTSKLVRLR